MAALRLFLLRTPAAMVRAKTKRQKVVRRRRRRPSSSSSTPVFRMYVLGSRDGMRTYVGVTHNIRRRLRQHNGELKGGARSTRGRAWFVAALVGNFASDRDALAVEHLMHDQGKTWAPVRGAWASPLQRRIACLRRTLEAVDARRFGAGGPQLRVAFIK